MYFFGGGIQHASAGTTSYGTSIHIVDLGVTYVPQDVFEMYLQDINPRYTQLQLGVCTDRFGLVLPKTKQNHNLRIGFFASKTIK